MNRVYLSASLICCFSSCFQVTIRHTGNMLRPKTLKNLFQALFLVYIVPAIIYGAFILHVLTCKEYSTSGILSLVICLSINQGAVANSLP